MNIVFHVEHPIEMRHYSTTTGQGHRLVVISGPAWQSPQLANLKGLTLSKIRKSAKNPQRVLGPCIWETTRFHLANATPAT